MDEESGMMGKARSRWRSTFRPSSSIAAGTQPAPAFDKLLLAIPRKHKLVEERSGREG